MWDPVTDCWPGCTRWPENWGLSRSEDFCQGTLATGLAPSSMPTPGRSTLHVGPCYGLLAGLHAVARELGIVQIGRFLPRHPRHRFSPFEHAHAWPIHSTCGTLLRTAGRVARGGPRTGDCPDRKISAKAPSPPV